jgi:hypothetical protein
MRALRLIPLALILLAAGAMTACTPQTATPTPAATPTPGAVTILGPSELTAQQITDYVCHVNRCTPVASGGTWKPEISTLQMAQLFIDEGNLVGVRGDIAFCQSVLETGWFAWTSSPWPETAGHPDDGTWDGHVLAVDHNYAGLGAFNGTTVFMRQASPQLGVRAQLQHLRNYADINSTSNNLGAPFQPRVGYTPTSFDSFHYKGQAPTWVQLNGKWAVPGDTYAQTILDICNNMRTFAGLAPVSASSTAGGAAQTTGSDPTYDDVTQQLQNETRARN